MTCRAWLLLAAFLTSPVSVASANVVADWDEKAVAFIQPRMVPPVAYRAIAIVHIAMFDAVNSIEPVYRPYYAQLPATRETSKEAAAAAAAGTMLIKLLPEAASDIQVALKSYLAAIPEGDAKSNGIKLGDAVAAKILEARVFSNSIAVNNGNGTFSLHPMPREAQFAPVYATVAGDFDGDGNIDLVLAGNFFGFTPLLGRHDASYGLLLHGDGKGAFTAADMTETKLVIDGQVRHMALLGGPGGMKRIAVARNNDTLEILQVRR